MHACVSVRKRKKQDLAAWLVLLIVTMHVLVQTVTKPRTQGTCTGYSVLWYLYPRVAFSLCKGGTCKLNVHPSM